MLWVAFTGPWSTDKQETWAPALAVASFLQSTRWRLGRSRYCCLVPLLHSRTAYCLAYNGPCQGLLFINPVKLRPAYVGCYGSYSLAHAHRVEGHRLEQRPIDTFPFRLSIYIIPATCLRLLHVCRIKGGMNARCSKVSWRWEILQSNHKWLNRLNQASASGRIERSYDSVSVEWTFVWKLW